MHCRAYLEHKVLIIACVRTLCGQRIHVLRLASVRSFRKVPLGTEKGKKTAGTGKYMGLVWGLIIEWSELIIQCLTVYVIPKPVRLRTHLADQILVIFKTEFTDMKKSSTFIDACGE